MTQDERNMLLEIIKFLSGLANKAVASGDRVMEVQIQCAISMLFSLLRGQLKTDPILNIIY